MAGEEDTERSATEQEVRSLSAPAVQDKVRGKGPINTPSRPTYDLEENELIAVVNCRIRIRKQFQVAFTKEGHLRQRFVALLDRKDGRGEPLFAQEVINANCPKREVRRIASQNPLLFTASGRLRSRASKKLTDKHEQGKFAKYGVTEVKKIHEAVKTQFFTHGVLMNSGPKVVDLRKTEAVGLDGENGMDMGGKSPKRRFNKLILGFVYQPLVLVPVPVEIPVDRKKSKSPPKDSLARLHMIE
ncbi:hypothetical protein N7468_009994 [Penicillium chermesinum]|uniref:Uncharacterized protein n=1 Tax=Penicillium chermesinum TaxID=63820 RepID=A0A9W9NBT9_9EURO|nr:uncharacterized protein N7468_009994 [Penicillium chermesinum]KAJ5216986.1 hypothetical protein N7468_009994 [Penicillium chermesinum]KAJ6171398.1 hypothetical protein N7470_000465 [Penicillium chermesinum]